MELVSVGKHGHRRERKHIQKSNPSLEYRKKILEENSDRKENPSSEYRMKNHNRKATLHQSTERKPQEQNKPSSNLHQSIEENLDRKPNLPQSTKVKPWKKPTSKEEVGFFQALSTKEKP